MPQPSLFAMNLSPPSTPGMPRPRRAAGMAAWGGPAATAPNHATLLGRAEKRLLVEWMDLGAQRVSSLLNKALGQGVLHAGGASFCEANDINARVLAGWNARPLPKGQDEFSAAGRLLFPTDFTTGSCTVP